jgi:hypothetical protein
VRFRWQWLFFMYIILVRIIVGGHYCIRSIRYTMYFCMHFLFLTYFIYYAEKLYMPTVPSSTPAPLPTKQGIWFHIFWLIHCVVIYLYCWFLLNELFSCLRSLAYSWESSSKSDKPLWLHTDNNRCRETRRYLYVAPRKDLRLLIWYNRIPHYLHLNKQTHLFVESLGFYTWKTKHEFSSPELNKHLLL